MIVTIHGNTTPFGTALELMGAVRDEQELQWVLSNAVIDTWGANDAIISSKWNDTYTTDSFFITVILPLPQGAVEYEFSVFRSNKGNATASLKGERKVNLTEDVQDKVENDNG